MDEEKKASQEEPEKKKKKLSLNGIFYHNTFVLIFSFCVALISWFVLAAGNGDSNRVITDVPISVKLSSAAEEDGFRVFNVL